MAEENKNEKKKPLLHRRILFGLILGAFAGVLANWMTAMQVELKPKLLWIVANLTEPVGQVFLRMLFMVVVPLVFSSLTLGVAGLGDLRKLGRIGAKTFAYFFLVTTVATVIGLALVNTVKPGEGLPTDVREALLASYRGEAQQQMKPADQGAPLSVKTFVEVVPRNPLDAAAKGNMLALIFFSLMVGVALTQIAPERGATFIKFLEGLGDATVAIIGMAMKFAPYGVFALIFSITARFGFDILRQLGIYVTVVIVGLAIHQFGVFSILVKIFAGLSPLYFFRRVRSVMITAFSTSSSNATLPTTLKVSEEELGIPPEIAGFVLPLGATMNMNGTALFEGVTVLFLAQVFGVHLGISAQIAVVLLSVLSAIGAAGVPGGSIPLLVMILQSVGVPGEGIAIIIGVDRILDMCRTVLNVTGDITAAAFITRSEGFKLNNA